MATNQFIKIEVDKTELNQIAKDIERLLPPRRGTKTIVRQAMRKAMKPLLAQLKSFYSNHKDSGALVKSLGLINGKGRRDSFPSVYVGPRKKATGKGRKLPTGYMYYIEYGRAGESPKRYLDKSAKATAQQVYGSIIPSLRSIIDKRFKKKGLI